MKQQLSIPEWTTARLVSVTPRQECHGDEKVVALTMRFRLSGHNELLDPFGEDLRRGIFAGKDELQGIRTLPNVDEPTPHLRARGLEGMRIPLPLKTDGATVLIDHGIEGDVEPITMGDSTANKVSYAGYDGGSADIEFNVGTSDIDSEELGIICGKLGSEFPIKILAPKEVAKPATDAASDPRQSTLDGTTGAELGEHSDARKDAEAVFSGGILADAPDATTGVVADVEKNGAGNSAKTPGQIRAAKGAATRKAKAAA